jgi:low affinity Fe/Cu permease
MSMQKAFATFSRAISKAVGTPYAFVLAASSVVVWALTGPVFAFSETWQLVINTGTTIVTFLMVFLIQNSQNRDSEALQLKLDEIIFALSAADDSMIDIERLDQDSLDALQKRYAAVLGEAKAKREGKKPVARKPPSRRKSRAK